MQEGGGSIEGRGGCQTDEACEGAGGYSGYGGAPGKVLRVQVGHQLTKASLANCHCLLNKALNETAELVVKGDSR